MSPWINSVWPSPGLGPLASVADVIVIVIWHCLVVGGFPLVLFYTSDVRLLFMMIMMIPVITPIKEMFS